MKGYKTYTVALLGVIVVLASAFGSLDTNAASTILAVLGFGGLAALRNAVK